MKALGKIEVQTRFIVLQDNRQKPRKNAKDLALLERAGFSVTDAKNLQNAGVVLVPVSEIETMPELFQNRKADFSQSSVNSIISAVEDGTFNWEVFDAVLLWDNKADNNLIVLSGHSRTAAFKILASRGVVYKGRDFKRIPAKLIQATKTEAVKIARESNSLSTLETDTERALYYNKLRADGTAANELKKLVKDREKNNANFIWAYSFLNPSGKVFEALEQIETADATSKTILKNIALWIGKAREKYPLTNSHEKELYDWLMFGGYGTKANQIANQTDFLSKVDYLVKRNSFFDQFDSEKPLNVNNVQQKSAFMSDYETKLREVEKDLSEAKSELETKRRLFIKAGKKGSELNELLRKYNDSVNYAANKIIELKSRYSQVIEAEKAQKSLFGLGKPYMKLEFETNSDLLEFKKSIEAQSIQDNNDKPNSPEPGSPATVWNMPPPGVNGIIKGLGAYEVLQQNSTNKKASYFVPTYQISNVWEYLPKSLGRINIIERSGGLDETLNTIREIVTVETPKYKNLAEKLKADSLLQTCFNIWHFLRSRVVFRDDTPGTEQLRTLPRLLSDGFGDCDDFSIASAALLSALGYKPNFHIVAFNGNANYGHIYVVVNNIVLDGVMNEFNKHPEHITKTKVMSLQISQLSGLSGINELLAVQSGIFDAMKLPNSNKKALANELERVQLAIYSFDIDTNSIDLNGLGKESVWNKIKNAGKKIIHTGNKYLNATTIVGRNAMYLVLSTNALGYAKKMAPAYYSDAKAEALGYDLTELAKLREKVKKFTLLMYGAGGEESSLRRSILDGAKLKDSDLQGLGSLGSVAAALASASTFIASLVAMLKDVDFSKLMKTAKDVKKVVDMVAPPKTDKPESNLPDSNIPVSTTATNNGSGKEVNTDMLKTAEDNKNKWILPAAIAAGVLIFLVTKK